MGTLPCRPLLQTDLDECFFFFRHEQDIFRLQVAVRYVPVMEILTHTDVTSDDTGH